MRFCDLYYLQAMESVATSAKAQVMKSLPIDIKESAVSAINNYKSESCKCVFLTLTAGTQGIEGEEKKEDKISEIQQLLNDTDPKYILFWYSKSRKDGSEEEQKDQSGNKRIFGYYCPDKADRKLRFTYSTQSKCNGLLSEYWIRFYSKVEVSSVNEFNAEYMDYHIS